MEDDLNYLLTLPQDEIIKAVLEEAIKDLTITQEEQKIIDQLRKDLKDYNISQSQKFTFDRINQDHIKLLLIEQRKILKKFITNAYSVAQTDNVISEDEMNVINVLMTKVDEIIAIKIGLFVNLDMEEQESLHPTIFVRSLGQKFSDLFASLYMDIISEKVAKINNVSEITEILISGEVSSTFVNKFKSTMIKILDVPMKTPNDLLSAIESVSKTI